MAEQQKFEKIEVYLDKNNYAQAIEFLETCIEEEPEELIYYWYLGLAYLLQENEELAQEIWLSIFLQGNLKEVEEWTLELTSFLECHVQENIDTRKLGNAKVIYEAISVIKPDYKNLALLNNLVNSLSYFASSLIDKKESIEVYLEILKLNPEHLMSWHYLALQYYDLEQYSKAEESIKKAIELDNLFALNYHILGLILEKSENHSSAIYAYQEAIKLDSTFIESYNRLGDIYFQKKKLDKAIAIYKAAVRFSPNSCKGSIYEKIATIYDADNNKPFFALYLAYSACINNKNEAAIFYFEEFLVSHNDNIDVYLKLGFCYIMTNQASSAIMLMKNALRLFPNNPLLERLNQLILPVIYENTKEIKFYRDRFSQLSKKIIKETKLDTLQEQKDAFNSILLGTNFYLSYQGKNDLKIQKEYSNYVYKIIKKIYPQFCQIISLQEEINQRKIRIGYISLRLHSMGELYLGWLKYRDKQNFECYVYDISENSDIIGNQHLKFKENFKIYSDHMKFIPSGIDDICTSVINDKLDILIFPEIGLDPNITPLTVMRLAPIQCTTWGQPITSGSPNIDYFLSSDLMEPENGGKHYSEKMVRLPNLGFSIEHPILSVSDKHRSAFELRDNAIVYLCCQTLFKYLPQRDYIFPSIAQHYNLFQFVFIDTPLGPVITNSFKKRIDKAFAKFGLHYDDYCVFLPRISFDDYLKLNELADVFLDSFDWSGGITTKDAIACGLPIVTCPGKMMRSRQSDGMLRMIGVTETIAETEAEYIEIAVRLGLDQEWRQRVKDKMMMNKHLLFDDRECIVALEAFFKDVIQKDFSKKL